MDVHSITTGRKRGRTFRGGWNSYEQLRRDLTLWMKQDRAEDAWFTTMVDLYRLPSDFPGLSESKSIPEPRRRAKFLEERLLADVCAYLNGDPAALRFLPYIQLHEFEALLFSEPDTFALAFPEAGSAVDQLKAIRTQFESPEHIDDGPQTAPSKRIIALLPGYKKTVAGLLIAREIGLAVLRRECSHFDEWVTTLLACA